MPASRVKRSTFNGIKGTGTHDTINHSHGAQYILAWSNESSESKLQVRSETIIIIIMTRSGYRRRAAVKKALWKSGRLNPDSEHADAAQEMCAIDGLLALGCSNVNPLVEETNQQALEIAPPHSGSDENESDDSNASTEVDLQDSLSHSHSHDDEEELAVVYENIKNTPVRISHHEGLRPRPKKESSLGFEMSIQLKPDDLLLQMCFKFGERCCPECKSSKNVNEMVLCSRCGNLECKICFVEGCRCASGNRSGNCLELSTHDYTGKTVGVFNYVPTKSVLENAVGDIEWDLEYQYFSSEQ
ncbi:unnamed protein product [Orchesella dallaii]|uniref:Apoptosis regulatory protein Siva n=1 Tax=Orchesella dallaii TaxID=48710 RepID=A0ABP1R860_9HEXA